jgi:UDPglucose 6-dehydrogenase
MHIAVIGTGYVGLVTGACLADFGQKVICVDSDRARISDLCQGRIPFYEPELADIVRRNAAANRLEFTTDVAQAVGQSLVIFLAVGTPPGTNGEADISQVVAAVESIAPYIDGYRVIATKSTVPAGTGALIADILRRRLPSSVEFDVASTPEFLREGSAVTDFMRPDRVVIGTNSPQAAAILKDIYRPLYLFETPIVLTTIETAELIKYASNAFLAVKISFMNEIANLCDEIGADVHVVARAMGLDKRIGPKFLHPGPGYGGSCLPKDTRALVGLGGRLRTPMRCVESAIEANDAQLRLTVRKVEAAVGQIEGATIAVLGLSFKPNTSDVREAPALFVCRELAASGATIRAFDPAALADARRALADCTPSIVFAADAYDAARDASAVVVMTEWNEFRALDLERLRRVMARPVLLDIRNVFDPAAARALGFEYYSTGRQLVGRAAAQV